MKALQLITMVMLLPIAFIGSSANAYGAGGCPAFNASMVDAAMMATDLSQTDPLEGFAEDSPKDGTIICAWVTDATASFYVAVGVEDGVAQVFGTKPGAIPWEEGQLRTAVFDLSPEQQHACRAQVLQSFVWKQYCKPMLP